MIITNIVWQYSNKTKVKLLTIYFKHHRNDFDLFSFCLPALLTNWRLRSFSYWDNPTELQKLNGKEKKKRKKLALVTLTHFVETALFFHATTLFYCVDLWKKHCQISVCYTCTADPVAWHFWQKSANLFKYQGSSLQICFQDWCLVSSLFFLLLRLKMFWL